MSSFILGLIDTSTLNALNDICNNINYRNEQYLQQNIDPVITNSTNHTSQNKLETQQQNAKKIQDTSKIESNTVTGGDTSQGDGNIMLASWDPRLSRIDGFLSDNIDTSTGKYSILVPFATETAASAYYNMVFTVESGVKDIITSSEKTQNIDKADSVKSGEVSNTTKNAASTQKGYRVFYEGKNGDGKSLTRLQSDGNMFGVASVINPYTLTKLCGALDVNATQGDGTAITENRLYDVRDQRRFYDRSVTTNNDFTSINNPTTTNIIVWSNNDPWGRTPYSFQDFVFCKYWNIIPNNRLITLRKYHAPVYDNLQFPDMYTDDSNTPNKDIKFAPIATVLTYFGEQTGNTLSQLMSFTTGTKWKDIESKLHEPTGDTGDNARATIDNMFTNGQGFTGAESSFLSNIQNGANWITGKMFSFGKFVGLLDKDGYNLGADQAAFEKLDQANIDPQEQLYSNRILGPVNRIDSTKARDAGLTFNHKLSITCEYVARPIGGVNTKAVMLDILSNALEIGSADAAFWGGGYKWMIHPQMYPFKNTKFKNSVMDKLYAGKIFGKDGALAQTVEGVRSLGTKDGDPNGSFEWSNVTDKLKNFLGESIGAIGSLLSSVSSAIFGGDSSLTGLIDSATDAVTTDDQKKAGAEKMNNLLGNVNKMWKSQVIQRSMMPSINNMKALLTGEPVGNWHLMVGNPLNPIMTIGNLICTEMTVTPNDELGPDDFPTEIKVVYSIEHGMDREKGSIQSMFNRGNGKIYELPDYIKATSDYETKVDAFTGNMSKSGWTQPAFMNNMAMAAMAGGIGGYKQYKLAPIQQIPTLAHTDGTVIAKFTPVDTNMAVSNIDGDNTFFGQNNSNRAWIRGTAATRKLMN